MQRERTRRDERIMFLDIIGLELHEAEQYLHQQGIPYSHEIFLDRKQLSHDKLIVVRVTNNMGHYHLVVCPMQFGVDNNGD